jgi:DNA-binding NarL/FixJ family response regulator
MVLVALFGRTKEPGRNGGFVSLLPDKRGLALMQRSPRRATIRDVSRTVLIVDDHEEFRHTVRALLEADGFEVVGEAPDGRSAIVEAERLRPRLVLLDIQLPDLDGFEVAARLAETGASPSVVLTSSRTASSYRRRLAQSPALGFIPKSELSGHALAALLA